MRWWITIKSQLQKNRVWNDINGFNTSNCACACACVCVFVFLCVCILCMLMAMTTSFGQGLSLAMEITYLARLVDQQAWWLSCLHLPRTGITFFGTMPAFSLGAGNPMSGPHTCTVNAFLSKPTLWPNTSNFCTIETQASFSIRLQKCLATFQ